MIGNFSFEEHDRYFTRMYNHLRFIDRTLDIATIINIIKCKVILEQERENIMHNLNIKNISNTPMIKDFKIWSSKYDLHSEAQSEDEDESEAQSEAQSEEESEAQSETQSEDESGEDESGEDESGEDESETQSEYEDGFAANGKDENDYSALEEFRRNYRNSAAQSAALSRVRRDNDLPDDY